MASNNYTQANVVPSSDTFREWVDLTNRITFDMEKVVVTTIANTQGAHTAGNAYVNGFFSANTLHVVSTAHANGDISSNGSLRGTKATPTVYGTAAVAANLVVSSNLVLIANSTANAILHAESNAHFTGSLLQSNATLNDFNSNVDIDNALTDIAATKINLSGTSANITSTTLTIDGTTLDLNSNVDLDAANVNIDATKFDLTGTTANLHSTTTTIKGTTLDVDSNVDIDSASVTIDGGTLAVGSILDQNANVDIDNALTDITSTTTNISGTTATIDSTTLNIHGTSLDVNSNTNIDGDITTTANATIGNANSDLLTVTANAVFSDKIKVTKNAQFDADVTVDGHTTLNGNTVIGDAIGTDEIKLNALVNTAILPTTNGTLSIGNTVNRWDGNFDDLNADELTVIQDATIGGDADITGEVNAATAAIVGLATIGGNVVVSGDIDGADDKEANVYNAVVRNDLTVSTNTVLNGNTTIAHNKDFIVGNSTIKTLQSNQSGNVRVMTIGQAAGANDRIVIKSSVGNSSVGFIPLHGNNVILGNTTNRWHNASFTNANTSGTFVSTGDITANADVDITGEANTATLRVRSTSAMGGKLTISSDGAAITGPVDLVNSINVGANVGMTTAHLLVKGTATVGNTIANSSVVHVGNSTVNTHITKGGIDTDGTLAVLGAAAVSNTLAAGNTTITGFVNTSAGANVATTLMVGGTTTLKGDVDLGDETSDTVSYTGRVDTSIEPSVSGKVLGHASRRWAAALTTANTSGDITAGADVDITGEANTNTLRVRSTTVMSDNLSLNTDTATKQIHIGNSTANAVITANGNITARHLEITQSATLPTDTTLTAAQLGATDLTVTGNTIFTAAADADAFLQFGTSSPDNDLSIDFQNAKIISDILPDGNTAIDIGSTSLPFSEGHYDTLVQVGGSGGIVLSDGGGSSQANVTADNIFARDDLVGASSSDQILKEDILKINTAIDKVDLLSGYEFTWNDLIGDERAGSKDYGVIAQEIENVLPHAVNINSRGHKTVNYNSLIPLLIEAVKELSARVKELEEPKEEIDG